MELEGSDLVLSQADFGIRETIEGELRDLSRAGTLHSLVARTPVTPGADHLLLSVRYGWDRTIAFSDRVYVTVQNTRRPYTYFSSARSIAIIPYSMQQGRDTPPSLDAADHQLVELMFRKMMRETENFTI
jgi:hypothetical protein